MKNLFLSNWSAKSFPPRKLLILGSMAVMASSAVQAANVYWLGNIDGDGVWDTSTANWASGGTGGSPTAFANGDNTFFHLPGGNLNLTEDLSTAYQQIGQSGGSAGIDYVFSSNVSGGVTLDYTGSAPIEFLGSDRQLTIGSGVTARITTGNDGTLHVRGNGNTLNVDGGTLVRTGASVMNLSNVTVNVVNGGVLGGDPQAGNQIFLGRGAAATLNVGTGGTVHVGEAAGGTGTRSLIVGVGSGGSGEVTLSDGAVNIYNGGNSALLLGDNQSSGTTATFNLDGGVLHTRQIREQDSNGGVTSTFNFNGGVLEVSANNTATTNFMEAVDSAVVEAGGAIIDTNGQSVTINQTLTHDAGLGSTADGGLTKQGVGALTLTGNQGYTGDTVILGGTDGSNLSTLILDTAFLSDTADVVINEFGFLNLDFAGSDTIGALLIDGLAMSTGTWGASGSGADNVNDTYFGGTGQLLVTAVPEASSFAFVLGGLSLMLIITRRGSRE